MLQLIGTPSAIRHPLAKYISINQKLEMEEEKWKVESTFTDECTHDGI